MFLNSESSLPLCAAETHYAMIAQVVWDKRMEDACNISNGWLKLPNKLVGLTIYLQIHIFLKINRNCFNIDENDLADLLTDR